jgi:hypothetical protein
VGSAAPRSQAAKFLWGLVEQDVGVVVHGVLRTPHSLALEGNTSKPKVVSNRDTDDEKAMPGKVAQTASERRLGGR